MDDFGSDSFRVLLHEGAKGPGPKAEALEALSLRPVWLATWEPQAEGFRTLINADGEEALAMFSSEKELKAAAARFDWLAEDGTIAAHRTIGGDMLRHAWTREYAFVVIDIGSDHSLEYDRTELKQILRELESTGPFRTSRPPAPTSKATAQSSFPPPVERVSTTYSMGPSHIEKLDRLSDLPTKPHEAPHDSEPPTKPRAAVSEAEPKPRKRVSSRPANKPKGEPPAVTIEEVSVRAAEPGDSGTYGAASIIPPPKRRPKSALPETSSGDDVALGDSSHPAASSAPKLNSEVPTAPGAQGFLSTHPGKLKLPPIGPIGAAPVEP
ncbi:MAG: SseB family protein, partial [Polyangiales bacterium]